MGAPAPGRAVGTSEDAVIGGRPTSGGAARRPREVDDFEMS
jgi:hypothetical protein